MLTDATSHFSSGAVLFTLLVVYICSLLNRVFLFQPVTFSSVRDMLSVSVTLPEATLAYIVGTQSLYVRVAGGWKEILVSHIGDQLTTARSHPAKKKCVRLYVKIHIQGYFLDIPKAKLTPHHQENV